MYLNEVDNLTNFALNIYQEPSLKSGKMKKDYKKQWAEYYIIAKTLLKCYDNLSKNPINIFEEESLQYSIARVETESKEKKKLYTIYLNALNTVISLYQN